MSSAFTGPFLEKTQTLPGQEFSKKEIISLERVRLQYPGGPIVFRDVSYNIFVGDFYFLTGPSGTGKTSLLKLLYRALQPTYGRVRVFGYDLSSLMRADLPVFRQHIGLIFQDCRLIDHMTVLDNVAISIHVNGCNLKRSYGYAKELLEWVGLQDKFGCFPPTLSDGQKQRVAIARAVIKRPALLLADEPTGNLDNQNAFRLMALFEELRNMGTTIVLATHNNALIKLYSYPRLLLQNGTLFVGCGEAPSSKK